MADPERKVRQLVPNNITNFGIALGELKATYLFNNSDLLREGTMTKTDVQSLSRASRSVGHILTSGQNKLDGLITGVADGVKSLLSRRGLEVQEEFSVIVRESLQSAVQQDISTAFDRPIALKASQKLAELTGRSFVQLLVDLEGSPTPERLWELWFPNQGQHN